MLQGDSGYSRKGPSPASASYYYSLPHLAVHGRVRTGATLGQVSGSAWLDHEWSSEYLSVEAVGWDWIGVNLDQGGALMAFRMRDRRGGQYWAAATIRLPGSPSRSFGPDAVRWMVRRWWQSPRTGARYPIGIRVEVGELAFELEPLMDDQESDARMSTGTIYWEGAVTATREGRHAGRGYLELTGYAGALKM